MPTSPLDERKMSIRKKNKNKYAENEPASLIKQFLFSQAVVQPKIPGARINSTDRPLSEINKDIF